MICSTFSASCLQLHNLTSSFAGFVSGAYSSQLYLHVAFVHGACPCPWLAMEPARKTATPAPQEQTIVTINAAPYK